MHLSSNIESIYCTACQGQDGIRSMQFSTCSSVPAVWHHINILLAECYMYIDIWIVNMASNTTLELHKSEETRTNNNMQVELRNESEGQDSSSPPSRKRKRLSLTPSEAQGVSMSAQSPTVARYRGSFKLWFLRKWYSVPHEESRKMFLFIVHFASFLQNQLSYGHVLCTTMIPYLPWFHRVLWLLVIIIMYNARAVKMAIKK